MVVLYDMNIISTIQCSADLLSTSSMSICISEKNTTLTLQMNRGAIIIFGEKIGGGSTLGGGGIR